MNTTSKILINFLCLFILRFSQISAQNDELTEQYQKVNPSVVAVLRYDEQDKFIGHGSGFFISASGQVVTNHHVVENAYKLKVRVKTSLSTIEEFDVINIYKASENYDLAILQIDSRNHKFQFVKLQYKLPNIGERCFAVSTPDDLVFQNQLSEGKITNKITVDNNNQVQIVTNAQINFGSSGSPLFNSKGEVIGIIVGFYDSRVETNIAIPTEYLNYLPETNQKTIINYTKLMGTVTFYTNSDYQWKHAIYVDGIYLGSLKTKVTGQPNCGDDYTISTKVEYGFHYYEIRFVNGYSIIKNFNIDKGNCIPVPIGGFTEEEIKSILNPSYNSYDKPIEVDYSMFRNNFISKKNALSIGLNASIERRYLPTYPNIIAISYERRFTSNISVRINYHYYKPFYEYRDLGTLHGIHYFTETKDNFYSGGLDLKFNFPFDKRLNAIRYFGALTGLYRNREYQFADESSKPKVDTYNSILAGGRIGVEAGIWRLFLSLDFGAGIDLKYKSFGGDVNVLGGIRF